MREAATVLFFGPAREAAGHASIEWAIPADGVAAADLVTALGERFPRLAPTLKVARYFKNGELLRRPLGRIRPGDEFAVHPPYGGG